MTEAKKGLVLLGPEEFEAVVRHSLLRERYGDALTYLHDLLSHGAGEQRPRFTREEARQRLREILTSDETAPLHKNLEANYRRAQDLLANQQDATPFLEGILEAYGELARIPDTAHAPRIFLSYAAADRDLVHRLSHGLKQAGLQPWMDTDILRGVVRRGSSWRKVLDQLLERSDILVPVLSRHALTRSGQLRTELRHLLETAQHHQDHLKIVPVHLNGDYSQPDASAYELPGAALSTATSQGLVRLQTGSQVAPLVEAIQAASSR